MEAGGPPGMFIMEEFRGMGFLFSPSLFLTSLPFVISVHKQMHRLSEHKGNIKIKDNQRRVE